MTGGDIIFAQIMSFVEIKNKEIIGASQDKNKEWVLLFNDITSLVMKNLFILIYKEESKDLGNTLAEEIYNNTAYFAVTSASSINNNIGEH